VKSSYNFLTKGS